MLGGRNVQRPHAQKHILYFKGQGRQEQEGKKMTPKTKGNNVSRNSCKQFATTEKISILFHGKGAIEIDVTRYMFSCVLLMQQPWNLMPLVYFTSKKLLKCHRKKKPLYANSNSLGKYTYFWNRWYEIADGIDVFS